LSSAVAATIFVVGAGQVRTRLVRAAVKRLQFSRAALIGAVITRFDVRSSYGYGYGYGYGNAYGYGGRERNAEPAAAAVEGVRQSRLPAASAEG
jgi:Mrp family chromosome partitioning ATPase